MDAVPGVPVSEPLHTADSNESPVAHQSTDMMQRLMALERAIHEQAQEKAQLELKAKHAAEEYNKFRQLMMTQGGDGSKNEPATHHSLTQEATTSSTPAATPPAVSPLDKKRTMEADPDSIAQNKKQRSTTEQDSVQAVLPAAQGATLELPPIHNLNAAQMRQAVHLLQQVAAANHAQADKQDPDPPQDAPSTPAFLNPGPVPVPMPVRREVSGHLAVPGLNPSAPPPGLAMSLLGRDLSSNLSRQGGGLYMDMVPQGDWAGCSRDDSTDLSALITNYHNNANQVLAAQLR